FGRGLRGGMFTASMPASARIASNEAVNCPARSPDQEPEFRGAVTEVHQEIADLLSGPRPVRMCGDAEDVPVAAADFDHEEAVQALECYRAVDMEEVGGEHCRGVHAQELPPRGVSAP